MAIRLNGTSIIMKSSHKPAASEHTSSATVKFCFGEARERERESERLFSIFEESILRERVCNSTCILCSRGSSTMQKESKKLGTYNKFITLSLSFFLSFFFFSFFLRPHDPDSLRARWDRGNFAWSLSGKLFWQMRLSWKSMSKLMCRGVRPHLNMEIQ